MGRGRGQHERHTAVRLGDRGDPRGRAGDQRVVERLDAREHVEGVEHRGRLARGIADVGLEGMTEPAVGIAVGAQCVEDRVDRRPAQQDRQPMAVEETSVRVDEPLRCIDVNGHAAKLRGGQLGVFQESDRRQTGQAAHLVAHVRLARVAGLERSQGQ